MLKLKQLIILVLMLTLLPIALSTRPTRAQTAGPYHNSRDSQYRTPFGAVPIRTAVTLRLSAPSGSLDSVTIRTSDRNANAQSQYPMQKVTNSPDGLDYWEATVTVPPRPTLFYYRFILRKGDTISFYEDDARDENGNFDFARKGGPGVLLTESRDQSWQITVYTPDFTTPQWIHDAVIYQIFPDRFRNGDKSNDPKDGDEVFYGNLPLRFHKTWNEMVEDFKNEPGGLPNRDFFGGDLKGIQEKLPYLKDLGVTAIYLNPIFQARSNHRYDTEDYLKIDKYLGTEDDWNALVEAAKAQGIRLILDGVFNHVSSDGPYFDRYRRYDGEPGACEDVKSKYRNWFFFRKPGEKEPKDACVDDGKGQTYYESWAGFDSIPKLNNANPQVRDFIYKSPDSVARTWIRNGASGWRLDVAGEIDDGGETSMYWEEFRDAVKSTNPDAVIIGEIWDDVSPWVTGTQFDSTMNYRLRSALLGYTILKPFRDNDVNWQPLMPSQLDSAIMSMLEDYPPQATEAMMNLMDSHDTSRLLYVVGNDKQSQQLAAFLQFMMPGAPTIYYGDEIALNAPSNKDQDDPYNRAPYPWPDETGSYYNPPDPEMFNYYRGLAKLRADNPALRNGSYRALLTDDKAGVYAFLRTSSGNVVVVIANRSELDQPFSVDVQGYLLDNLILDDAMSGLPAEVKNGKLSGTAQARHGAAFTFNAQAVNVPLTATASDGEVMLSWPVRNALVRYNIYRSLFPNGGFAKLNPSPVDDTGSYIDQTVANGTLYYYYVEALTDQGLLDRRSKVVFGAPGGVIKSARLTPVYDAAKIVIPVRASGLDFIGDVTVDSTRKQNVIAQIEMGAQGTEFDKNTDWQPMTIQGGSYMAKLVPRKPGDYQAIARFSTNGGLDWTLTRPVAFTVTPPESTTLPAPPTNLKITQASLFNVTLTWDAVPGASAYRIYKGTSKDAKLLAETPNTTYRDVEAAEGNSYTYRVTAVDQSLNESQPTPELVAKVERQAVKVTFRVKVPANTPANSPVYIAGDFSSKEYPTWNPGGLKMTDKGNGTWEITLSLNENVVVQYKYVRGTWDAVEKGSGCEEIANRTFTVKFSKEGTSLREDTVARWRDVDKCG